MAQLFSQRTLTIGGMEPCAVGLQFHKTGFDQKENVVLFVVVMFITGCGIICV